MFGIDIIGAGLLPAMLVALAAGMLSFLSPCVLPIVPPYLAWIAGLSFEELQGAGENRGRAGRLLASTPTLATLGPVSKVLN